MRLVEHLQLIERVDHLIRRKATGNPACLARRLNLSDRQVYRPINTMIELGAPIMYSKSRQSYFYKEETSFNVGFFTNGKDRALLRGGCSHIFKTIKNFNISLPEFGSDIL